MDWINGMQSALAYIEQNLDGEIDYARLADLAQTSEYNFQRVFSMLTGFTLGEYIRMRRLTLAATELQHGAKVIDVAVRFGYDSPDSFARAFARFHGMPPSEAKQSSARLNSCSPLHIKLMLEGGNMLDYRIEHRDEMLLLGYNRHFEGTPDGVDRDRQEEELFMTTRAYQWMLKGMSNDDYNLDIVAITDVSDDGYRFWYCCRPHPQALEHLYDFSMTGIDFMEKFGFEQIRIPAGDYAVFTTPREKYPVWNYLKLRKQISSEWLPGAGYTLRSAPELAIYHWFGSPDRSKRYVEIWIPVEK